MATRVWLLACVAHAVDDAAQLRVELVGVEAPSGLGDVHHEVGAAFELVRDAHHGDEEAQVVRDRLLASRA